MRPFVIVAFKVAVEDRLHFFDGVEPGAPAFDPEVLVQERAVQPLHDPVGLRPLHPRGAVLDLLELQEQLIGHCHIFVVRAHVAQVLIWVHAALAAACH